MTARPQAASPATLPTAASNDARSVCERRTLPGAGSRRLYYAQVHEDPLVEAAALAPAFQGTIAVVSSGGCTALSLRAMGAQNVIAIDLNAVQNHMLELKAAATTALDPATRTAFLGGWPAPARDRLATYRDLSDRLSGPARSYWTGQQPLIGRGVLVAGISEQFMRGIVQVMRVLVHPRSRIDRLLACRTLDEQRALYWREWNSRRWQLLFSLLLGRRSLERQYESGMFANVETRNFAAHFHVRFEHTVTRLPVSTNYFLHYALRGRYPEAGADALPPYLARDAGQGNLTVVDAAFGDFLRTQRDGSIAGFALSNICEWLDASGIDALFAEIVRTAAPGAIVCFRNFVGWTEVPKRWRSRVVEDRAHGEHLLAGDRSLVNRRLAICRVVAEEK
jgi:S-adenosylmethionine-diacylglycerol 3-amino-3-carboxypropyl transferase